MTTKLMLLFVSIMLFRLHDLRGQITPETISFKVKLDTAKYPDYRPITLRPLWSKQSTDEYDAHNYSGKISDTLLFRYGEVLQLKTGQSMELRDINIRTAKRILSSNKDTTVIWDLASKKITRIIGSSNLYKRPPALSNDSILLYPTTFGVAAFDFNTERLLWNLRHEGFTYYQMVPYKKIVLTARFQDDWKTNSYFHSIVKISSKDEISEPIHVKHFILEMIPIGNHVALVCDTEIVIVDVPNWSVSSIVKLNVSQKYLQKGEKLVSPNVSVTLSPTSVSQTSRLAWQNASCWTWNDWLILNFDDGDVTRQFLVSSDRKKTYMLEYAAEDFAPCRIDGFVDVATLDFISSNGKYIAGICKCENGNFIFGFEFPELPD